MADYLGNVLHSMIRTLPLCNQNNIMKTLALIMTHRYVYPDYDFLSLRNELGQ